MASLTALQEGCPWNRFTSPASIWRNKAFNSTVHALTGRSRSGKKLSRGKVLGFLASQPRCLVAMEACAGAHYRGREIGRLGHEVKLIPPVYVKPFVMRH